MRRKKIAVVGHISLDITPKFHNSPSQKVGELLKAGKLVDVGQAELSLGGAVANTGLGLHTLGEDVVLMAKVGKDIFGSIVKQKLEDSGCTIELKEGESDNTSYTIVIAPKGCDRIFLHSPAANHTFAYSDIVWETLKDVGYFHFGYPTIMKQFYREDGEQLIQLFQKAKELGLITSLDLSAVDEESEAGHCNWEYILSRVLPYVDFFVPSIEELAFMLDKKLYEKNQLEDDFVHNLSLEEDIKPLAAKALHYGCKAILLKCGVCGLYLQTKASSEMKEIGDEFEHWGNIEYMQPCFVPEKVVSATGAGDTSIAAFLKAIMNGYSPKECVEYAAATGACCVTTYDAISGLQSFERLRERINAGWKCK